jgi:hypothetical protein
MRFDARKAVLGVLLAGLLGAALFPPGLYLIGLAVAPPRPIPAATAVPAVVGDAIWARANGGQAAALTPITPISMARFIACVAIEDFQDDTPGDAQRIAACRGYMPALQGVEYLSGMHMRDANLNPSFREGLGRFSTTVWLTHSWTKAELLNTLASRAKFPHGWRGIEQASQGYFGRDAAELSLPQAALLAAFIGEQWQDPWCGPGGSARLRHRVLEQMRDNLAIDDQAFQAADASSLDVAPPPADHPPCRD